MGDGIKLGLWGARGDRRGLAIQTSELALHLQPQRVMGFDVRSIGWSPHNLDWRDYAGLAMDVRDVNGTGRLVAQEWMRGLDVVWGAETFYNDSFPHWAQDVGVATIQHCNPEFYRFERERQLPRPSLVVVPTDWRLAHMPGAEVLPSPINRNRLPFVPRPLKDGLLTFLHVVGLPAVGDRNGTKTVMRALSFVQRPCRVVFRCQKNLTVRAGRHGPCEVVVESRDRADYWTLYEDADVLLMPRRYGGQCLPLQEAMSCGLPVLASDVAPQNGWLAPELLVESEWCGQLQTQAGPIDTYETRPEALAAAMDRLSGDLDVVARLSRRADRWAALMSWEALLPRYRDVVRRAVQQRNAA